MMRHTIIALLTLLVLGCSFEGNYKRTPVVPLPPPVIYEDTPVEAGPILEEPLDYTPAGEPSVPVGEPLGVPDEEPYDEGLVAVTFAFPHYAVLYFKTQPADDAVEGAACAEFEAEHLKQLAALHYDIITVDVTKNRGFAQIYDILQTPAIVCLAGQEVVAVIDNPTTSNVAEAYSGFRVVKAPPASMAMPKPKLVYYSGPNCGPCKAMSPIVDQLITKYGHMLDVEKVDVGLAPERLAETGQSLIPQFIITGRGRTDKRVGMMSYGELEAFIAPFLPVAIEPEEETHEFETIAL